jgi:UDP-N-acetylmuramyl pentapeptide phosphotransferase/UDP-N-acetylglucosamine-1-phosphate transferase
VSIFLLVLGWILLAAAAGFCVWLATAALLPWLARRATVHPNVRSSHTTPTPQGGGIAVVFVTAAAAFGALAFSGVFPPELAYHGAAVAVGAFALMAAGLLDDMRNLPILSRLAVQILAVGAVVVTLPPELRVLPGHLSFAVERTLIFLGGLWFVNLYNFMDGIDLMCVTETVAISIGVASLAALGLAPAWLGWVAASLAGAMLGFAPFNAPVARIFLGDAGSLAISLIVGTLLLHVAVAHTVAAAVILPLYYLMDSTITVIWRMLRGQKFWQGHRDHFYQQAKRNGRPVAQIIGMVTGLNAILIAVAVGAASAVRAETMLLTIVAAGAAVLLVLWRFAAQR